ncbi:MAG: MerR family transcriptional regulator, partial [Catenulispora sp.]
DLARRTGLPVKTIRFYADTGLVPPTDRSPAGYRLFDIDSVARLDLVRTLRDLGLDLPAIRKVLDREVSLAETAAAHADALLVQIRTLRLRRAVLTAVAKRGSTSQELNLMHKLAKLSEAERNRLLNDFIDECFGGLDANPHMVAMLRSAMPELPDEPTGRQVEAWVELAELSQNPDFRASVRRMAEYQAAERAAGDDTGLHHEVTDTVRARITQAIAEGVEPTSAAAEAIVTELAAQYAKVFGRPDDSELRHWLLHRLNVADDPEVERYWRLLSEINGWPIPESIAPVFDWFIKALEAQIARSAPSQG